MMKGPIGSLSCKTVDGFLNSTEESEELSKWNANWSSEGMKKGKLELLADTIVRVTKSDYLDDKKAVPEFMNE